MTSKHFNSHVEKRQRIKPTTLIIGVDIGCYFNMACFMKKNGEVVDRGQIYNSVQGFQYFEDKTEMIKKAGGFKEVIIGLEPTGNYWRKFAFFSMELGYEVRFIRTTALKHQRELDESSSSKSDMKDAYTLANITREGKYLDSIIEDGIFQELRNLVHLRDNIVQDSVRTKNKLRSFLDDYFPELHRLYSTMSAKSLLAILNECPFPEDVLKYGEERLVELISKISRGQKEGEKKGRKLFASAKDSIGLKKITPTTRYMLSLYLEDVKRSEKRLHEIEVKIKALLSEIPCAEYILSIPGISVISTGIFLGELGNPYNFKGPKQIVKYAGYDPVGHDSGKYFSKKHISKKGRWRLRKILYFMSLSAVRIEPYFKHWYKNKLEGGKENGRKLAKKEALCAVVIKLINVIFALIRDERMYEERTDKVLLAA